ncbi:MAG: triple tyrosine motif-containing protein, partial [Saprospiraceae bacterium]|nr:triple tyrosine motif-containing protein [Saprospiraceae bacterium]
IPFEYMIRDFLPVGQDDFMIGTNRGAYYYHATNDSLALIDYTECGYDHIIWGVLPLGDNRYLLCSDRGACTISLQTKTSQYYDIEHGLGNRHINWHGYLLHSSGKVWLGNPSGIVVIDTQRLEVPELPAQVNITSISMNGQEGDSLLHRYANTSNPPRVEWLRLPHAMNTVAFQFSALSYSGIGHHLYEYRLDGYDERWVTEGSGGSARYPNLPPGDYTFRVQVKDHPMSARALHLYIIPPFYMRSWFIILAAMSLAALIYGLVRVNHRRRMRMQQLHFEKRLALEQERVRIATDMHDDVGSGLSALNMRAQILAQQVSDEGLRSQLDTLAGGSRALTQKIREIIWTVNARNDTLDNLVTRLHQYALEFFEDSGIACDISLMQIADDLPLDGHQRRAIYLAYKEALNNVYRHSGAAQVHISIDKPADDQLSIVIRDDGSGFDPSSG